MPPSPDRPCHFLAERKIEGEAKALEVSRLAVDDAEVERHNRQESCPCGAESYVLEVVADDTEDADDYLTLFRSHPAKRLESLSERLDAFRHGVSHVQQNGVPGDLIKRSVGNSPRKTKNKYGHFTRELRKEMASKLG